MIELKNVTKKFGSTVAVNNLTLNIEKGIYGLVGQNGAGKSTLFRLISGVFDRDNGEISLDGYDADSQEGKGLVFFLSDDPYVEKHANMKDMIEFYSNFYEIDGKKFLSLIKLFELPLNGVLSKFSKGMKRQTFISLALSIKTKYLLLDEAFDGLDPIVLETIKDELLKSKEEGKVIVISSHNISTLEKLVDTFILISKGKLASNESTERFGQNFIKFQAMFKKDISKDELTDKGLNVVSFKKYGSIYNIVVLDVDNVDEIIGSVAPATLLERVPIDSEEIVKLSMLVAREEANNNENI